MAKSDQEYQVFKDVLKIEDPWVIDNFTINEQDLVLDIYIDFKRGAKFTCSYCDHPHAKVHDIVNKDRIWRHLNLWQHKTILHARIPRTICEYCNKVRTIHVDWSRPSSGFTRLFELELMELMKEMPVAAVARKVKEHDTRLWRIFHLLNVNEKSS